MPIPCRSIFQAVNGLSWDQTNIMNVMFDILRVIVSTLTSIEILYIPHIVCDWIGSSFHSCCTNQMGQKGNKMAVVDSKLRYEFTNFLHETNY